MYETASGHVHKNTETIDKFVEVGERLSLDRKTVIPIIYVHHIYLFIFYGTRKAIYIHVQRTCINVTSLPQLQSTCTQSAAKSSFLGIHVNLEHLCILPVDPKDSQKATKWTMWNSTASTTAAAASFHEAIWFPLGQTTIQKVLLPTHSHSPMQRQRETNPHFLPRRNDSVIEFTSQTQPSPPPHSRPLPPHRGRTSVEPPYGPRPQPPQQPLKPLPPQAPPRPHQDEPDSQHAGRGQHPASHHHDHHPFLRAPASRRTNPLAWLLAAFCFLFWIIIIVGGLIILIVYLVFRPRNPRFDISTATINAAYLDMGYLLNADVTVLANFTNPNTKVRVDFSYVTLDLYYDQSFVATRYIEPFSVARRESRFADVHMVASQVRLSMGQSLELQRQMDSGRVNFEIRGLFKATSKLGGIFQYSYGLYAHCHIAVTGPPTGVLIGKRCVTRR